MAIACSNVNPELIDKLELDAHNPELIDKLELDAQQYKYALATHLMAHLGLLSIRVRLYRSHIIKFGSNAKIGN
jgi:hypothetical protein